MRVLLPAYGSRGDVEPLAGLAVRLRALGAAMRVGALPDAECAERLAEVGVPPVLGAPGSLGIPPWADRVQLIDATYDGAWELPGLGAVTAPAAVLIRPDGPVAWAGDGPDRGLPDALTTWFGPPAA